MAFDPGTSVQGRKHCLPHGSLVAGNGIANDTEDEDVYLVFHFFGRGCRAVFGRVLTLLQILGHCCDERWCPVASAYKSSGQGKILASLIAPSLQATAMLMPLETKAFTWPSMSLAGDAGLFLARC